MGQRQEVRCARLTRLCQHCPAVNATVNEPNAYPQRCTYLRIAVPDAESTDLQRHFARVNDFIATARAAGGRTLVHCSAGMSRSVSLALAYLISAEGTCSVFSSDGCICEQNDRFNVCQFCVPPFDMSLRGVGMTLVDAFRLIKTKRSIVAPNPSFMRQLAEYEAAERQRLGKPTAGPSLDLEKYAANRFGKVDSYVIEAYEESRFK